MGLSGIAISCPGATRADSLKSAIIHALSASPKYRSASPANVSPDRARTTTKLSLRPTTASSITGAQAPSSNTRAAASRFMSFRLTRRFGLVGHLDDGRIQRHDGLCLPVQPRLQRRHHRIECREQIAEFVAAALRDPTIGVTGGDF